MVLFSRVKARFTESSLRSKLVVGFALILLVTTGLQGFSVLNIYRLTGLVRVMYDNPLMSSTFAQSAKYDFVKFDLLVRQALTSKNDKEFIKSASKANDFLQLMQDDLKVVQERTLHEKNRQLVESISKKVQKIVDEKNEIFKMRDAYSIDHWKDDRNRAEVEESLTALTDNEAELGFNFREGSDQYNKTILSLTYVFCVFSLLISFLVGSLVLRSILKPLRLLVQVCHQIAEGDFTMRASLHTSEEIKSLANSFNFMVSEIERNNANIRSLLNGMNDGLFFFDRERLLSQERSRATDLMMPAFEKYKKADELLASLAGVDRAEMSESMALLWENNQLGFDELVSLLPQELQLNVGRKNEQHVLLHYNPHPAKDGTLERVVVIAKDNTSEVRAKRQSEFHRERVARITTVSADLRGYQAFLGEADLSISKIYELLKNPSPKELIEIRRELHNLKSALSLYGFSGCAKIVHEIEGMFERTEELGAAVAHIEQFIERYRNDVRDLSELLRLEKEKNTVKISTDKFFALKLAVNAANRPELKAILSSIERVPLEEAFEKHKKTLRLLTEKAGSAKNVALTIQPGSSEVLAEEVLHLDTAIGHLLRNCFDHAVENRETRAFKGKPESGALHVDCLRSADGGLRFTFSDDGKGIDTKRLVEKALEQGHWTEERAKHATDKERVELIFRSGISTQAEVSESSGRGVGMDAVKSYVESLGGSITVETQTEKGTTFTLNIPSIETIHLRSIVPGSQSAA